MSKDLKRGSVVAIKKRGLDGKRLTASLLSQADRGGFSAHAYDGEWRLPEKTALGPRKKSAGSKK